MLNVPRGARKSDARRRLRRQLIPQVVPLTHKHGCLPIEYKAWVSSNTIKRVMQNLRTRLGPEHFLHEVPVIRCQGLRNNCMITSQTSLKTCSFFIMCILMVPNMIYCVLVSFLHDLIIKACGERSSVQSSMTYVHSGVPQNIFLFNQLKYSNQSLWRALDVNVGHNTPGSLSRRAVDSFRST